jgi:RND family efflux transporter MFP subunit
MAASPVLNLRLLRCAAMKRAACVFRLLGAAALGAMAGSCSKAPAANGAPTVAVARTVRTHLASTMTLQGEFHPYQDVLIYAKVSGYVSAIRVDIGDRVKAGDLIATLEVPELKDQLAAAAAGEVHAETENAIAHLNYQRLTGVNQTQPNLIAQQDLDDSQAKDSATAATVALAKADAAKYRTLVDYTRITAPFAGVITKRFADLGSLIQAGTSSGTMPMVELAEDDLLRLRFPVPEAETPLIHAGNTVQCTVDAVHRTFAGKIVRDEWAIERSTRTMIAEVDVPNPGGELKAGMYATIVLPLQTASGVLAVPLQSLSGDEHTSVMVLGGDGVLSERRVTTGLRTADSAEITSGLNEGDLVVVGDRSGLHPGDRAVGRPVDPEAQP